MLRYLAIAVSILLGIAAAPAQAQVDVGVSIGKEGLQSFYPSIGKYYKVPEKEVIVIRERGIVDEELPVAFFIAQKARVAPAAVIDLRMRGLSWMDITLHFGLSPAIFYVPVQGQIEYGVPYGKAYGHFKKLPRKEWRNIRFDDADIVNLVNLRFISAQYGYPREQVMRLRSEGRNFVAIDDEARKVHREKAEKRKSTESRRVSEKQRVVD